MLTTRMTEYTCEATAALARERGITQRQLVAEALKAFGVGVHPKDLEPRQARRTRGVGLSNSRRNHAVAPPLRPAPKPSEPVQPRARRLEDDLVAVAQVYCAHTGRRMTTISDYIFGDARRLANLSKGGTLSVTSWQRGMTWLRNRWLKGWSLPEEVYWPPPSPELPKTR